MGSGRVTIKIWHVKSCIFSNYVQDYISNDMVIRICFHHKSSIFPNLKQNSVIKRKALPFGRAFFNNPVKLLIRKCFEFSMHFLN